MLLPSPRHTPADLALWAELEKADLVHGARAQLAERVSRSLHATASFLEGGTVYCGVSWGKDSTALAGLLMRLPSPPALVWIRVEPIASPECVLVRDAFLSRFSGADYHEVEVHCRRDASGWHATGTLETGIRECERRWGPRRILGIRAGESFGRNMRCRRHGISSPHACAPLAWWSLADVMGFLAANGLPVHPAYAMLGGGRYPRDRLRVASLGGQRGTGSYRAGWEAEYYGDILRRLQSRP